MDGQQFDRMTQGLSRALSRRRFGAVLTALGLGAGLGVESRAKPKKKKKKKPKPCPNGQTRCGASCADTRTNTAHCGGCGRPCPSGQSCAGGQCQGGGCSGDREPCGGECVNTQTNRNHCGTCDDPCGAGEECVDGQCETPAATCARDDDCRPFLSAKAPRCLNGRCQCDRGGEGLCTLSNGTTICDACCPGGSGACGRPDEVCRAGFFFPECGCPVGYQECRSDDYGTCSRDFDSDIHRCGIDCVDCEQVQPGSVCCNGFCVRGTAPGSWPAHNAICSNCQPCPGETICCHSGPGTPSGCVVGDPSFAGPRCPQPPP